MLKDTNYGQYFVITKRIFSNSQTCLFHCQYFTNSKDKLFAVTGRAMDVSEVAESPEGVTMDIEETAELDEFVETFEAIDEEVEKDPGVYESMLKNERMDDCS